MACWPHIHTREENFWKDHFAVLIGFLHSRTRLPDIARPYCYLGWRRTGPHTGVDVHFRKDHVDAVVTSLKKQTSDARTYEGTLPFLRWVFKGAEQMHIELLLGILEQAIPDSSSDFSEAEKRRDMSAVYGHLG
jgi:hypothetical protein